MYTKKKNNKWTMFRTSINKLYTNYIQVSRKKQKGVAVSKNQQHSGKKRNKT